MTTKPLSERKFKKFAELIHACDTFEQAQELVYWWTKHDLINAEEMFAFCMIAEMSSLGNMVRDAEVENRKRN